MLIALRRTTLAALFSVGLMSNFSIAASPCAEGFLPFPFLSKDLVEKSNELLAEPEITNLAARGFTAQVVDRVQGFSDQQLLSLLEQWYDSELKTRGYPPGLDRMFPAPQEFTDLAGHPGFRDVYRNVVMGLASTLPYLKSRGVASSHVVSFFVDPSKFSFRRFAGALLLQEYVERNITYYAALQPVAAGISRSVRESAFAK